MFIDSIKINTEKSSYRMPDVGIPRALNHLACTRPSESCARNSGDRLWPRVKRNTRESRQEDMAGMKPCFFGGDAPRLENDQVHLAESSVASSQFGCKYGELNSLTRIPEHALSLVRLLAWLVFWV